MNKKILASAAGLAMAASMLPSVALAAPNPTPAAPNPTPAASPDKPNPTPGKKVESKTADKSDKSKEPKVSEPEFLYSEELVEELNGDKSDGDNAKARTKSKDKADKSAKTEESGDKAASRKSGTKSETKARKGSTSGAGGCVIAIDPGHNAVDVKAHDEQTGIYMVDYPNGKELADMWDVSLDVAEQLAEAGHKPVVLRESVDENVDYRGRIDRTEEIGADVAISMHSTPGVDYSMIIAQAEGGFREGPGPDGAHKKVTFDNADTAKVSKALSDVVAAERTKVEENPVRVTEQHSFDGRAPLWGGNTPILSLMSQDTPWLYSELGVAAGGGADGITDAQKKAYAEGTAKGLIAALEEADCGVDAKGDDKDAAADKADKKLTKAEEKKAKEAAEKAVKESKESKEPGDAGAKADAPAPAASPEAPAPEAKPASSRPANPNARTQEPAPAEQRGEGYTVKVTVEKH